MQGRIEKRLRAAEEELARTLGAALSGATYEVDVEPAGGSRGQWFRQQVIATAKDLGYFANLRDHHSWGRLVLRAGSHAQILVSLHATGDRFRGVVAGSACFFQRDTVDGSERRVSEPLPLVDHYFQINYHDRPEHAAERFDAWLEEALARGLAAWRQSLRS